MFDSVLGGYPINLPHQFVLDKANENKQYALENIDIIVNGAPYACYGIFCYNTTDMCGCAYIDVVSRIYEWNWVDLLFMNHMKYKINTTGGWIYSKGYRDEYNDYDLDYNIHTLFG